MASVENITLESKFLFGELANVLAKFEFLKTTYCDQEMIGRCVPTYEIENNITYLKIEMEYMAPYGNNTYTKCLKTCVVEMSQGKYRLGDLPAVPVFDLEEVDKFVERGSKFKNLTQKPTYKHVKGYMYVPTFAGVSRLPINSRVVIDPEGYKKYQDANRWHNNETLHHIPDDMCHATLPCVPVYSLEYRRWGEVPTDSICDIVFDETAFERTVLCAEYKKLISDLVFNFYNTECCDFIVGKKRGLVFLLKGLPGVGKTLTAHGIAEMTHRPLYTIGSGDIGTTPDVIDKTLQRIFNMVGNWNGIVLIDEADVFMSQRIDYDVQYNACVSVFLRLIESYFGILFLTTNRDHSIDPAFDSRIHIRLRYPELEEDDRAKVWNESFIRYKITNVDSSALKKVKLNNREIANIVQLAYISNGGNPDKITFEVIDSFVKLRHNFSNEKSC